MVNDYRVAGDNLLSAAFAEGQRIPERLELLQKVSEQVGALILRPWEKDVGIAHFALHDSLTLACLPSLESVATNRLHDHTTAESVAANLQDLSKFITQSHLRPETSQRVKGQLSEIAVAGILWWGIAKGYWPDSDYVLPASSAQDRGAAEGRRNGIDLVWRHIGKHKRDGVQVKSSTRSLSASYRPDIIVIESCRLVGRNSPSRSRPIASLIEALAEDKVPVLSFAQRQISDIVKRTKENARNDRVPCTVLPAKTIDRSQARYSYGN